MTETATTPAARSEDPVDVVAAILWRGGLFLAGLRPEGKALAGYWEFPGGKVEPGEAIEAALLREVAEELCVQPLQWEFWFAKEHRYPHLNVRLHFFHVPLFDGEPVGGEGQEIVWFDPRQDFSTVNFLPVDRDIVAALKNLPYAADLK